MDIIKLLDKRAAQREKEAYGLISDSIEVRKKLMEKVNSGEITLHEAQAMLKKIKKDGKTKGLKTRNQVFRES